jgi:hypothetical protein
MNFPELTGKAEKALRNISRKNSINLFGLRGLCEIKKSFIWLWIFRINYGKTSLNLWKYIYRFGWRGVGFLSEGVHRVN